MGGIYREEYYKRRTLNSKHHVHRAFRFVLTGELTPAGPRGSFWFLCSDRGTDAKGLGFFGVGVGYYFASHSPGSKRVWE